jgi:gliding motility-associated-like protein
VKFLPLILLFITCELFGKCDSAVFIPENFDWKLMTDSTRFKPVFAGGEPDRYKFTIHDKWGETVFDTDIPMQGWNGLFRNRKGNCTAGTFMWTLDCEWTGDSVSVFCMGYVTCHNSCVVKVTALDTLQCRPTMYIPNAFTPNGDGPNDMFMPLFGCPPVNYEFFIFDRWGNLIFETRDVNKGWDGTIAKNEIAQTDNYVWKIKCSFFEGDKKRQFIGHVALIR